MGRFKEISIQRLFEGDHDLNAPIQARKQRKPTLPIAGQVDIDSLLTKSIIVPETQLEIKKNTINPIPDSELPVNKRYLNTKKVAFINPKNILFIKNNFLTIGEKKILGDANFFCNISDEEVVKRLVVFPDNTLLCDDHSGKEMLFTGGILALPLRTTDDWGYKKQSFMYVGNFSQHDESRNQKSKTGYKELLTNGTYKWRTISVGQELPANYQTAIRIQLSETGVNNVLSN